MQEQEFIESRVEIEKVLREEDTGYLGLSMGGKPYVVPLNYHYMDGRIIFHCSFTGKKLDYMKANPEVCFAVGRQPGQVREHPGGDPCHVDSDSVICYGRARVLEDIDERKKALNAFNTRFRPGASELTSGEGDEMLCGGNPDFRDDRQAGEGKETNVLALAASLLIVR
ncbi:MAG: pyridoxamine 5'-phosphate oxidase family protein [Deltaproteobacteria bacterium]